MHCRRNHGQTDRAVLKFDIDADLSSVFHWNVKQLFVFLIAEYKSDTNVRCPRRGRPLMARASHRPLI